MVEIDSNLSRKNSNNWIMNGHSGMMNNYGVSELPALQNTYHPGSSGLVHDPGFAVEWSTEEQAVLDDGLVRFANDSPVMKYVKIAGLLTHKTTRDVAMRCNWMKKKRRKQNQPIADKKMSMRQDVSSKQNLPSAPQLNMAQHSHGIHNMNQMKQLPYQAIGPVDHLLQENRQLFAEIDNNISSFKVQENMDLFRRTRNNFIAILNNMKDLRGTSSPMPQLPVVINENLVNSLLQDQTQNHGRMFGYPNGSF